MSNSPETTENIKMLLEMKHTTHKEMYDLENEIKILKNRIHLIENKLMNICVHKWEYDDCYGMYDKPDKICKLCDSRIIRF